MLTMKLSAGSERRLSNSCRLRKLLNGLDFNTEAHQSRKPMELLTPILHREFLVRSRRRATFHLRLVTAGFALLIASLVLGLPFLIGGQVQQSGALVFQSCANLLWFFCMFEGIRVSFDCLSSERRDGTIGLLFLTRMSGWEVVLGKLASGFISSFYNLLAALPVLGLMILLGGVGLGEFARVCLALVTILTSVISVGVLISARSLAAGRALSGMCLLLVFWEIAAIFVKAKWMLVLPSPRNVFDGAFESQFSFGAGDFWGTTLILLILSVASGVAAGRMLEKKWRQGTELKAGRRSGGGPWARLFGLHAFTQVGERHPIRWLLLRRSGLRFVKPLAIVGAILAVSLAFVLPLGFGIGGFFSWIILGVAIVEGSRLMVGSEGDTCLELVLTTSVTVQELMDQLRHHGRSLALQGALIVLVLEVVAFVVSGFLAVGRDATGAILPGLLGRMNAQMNWMDFLQVLGSKMIEFSFGAIASYMWFCGVYWYSLFIGARSSSIASALGRICLVIFVGYALFLWVGMGVFMFAVFAPGRFTANSPFSITLLMAFINSGLMVVFFYGLRRHAFRSLAIFLAPSLPGSHRMTGKRNVSLR